MLFKLAIRNVFRHTRRTLITAVAIGVGLMFMIMIDSMFGGMENQTVRNILETDNSELVVYPAGVFEDRFLFPLDTLIEDASAMSAELEQKYPDVISATPRLRFAVFAIGPEAELFALGMGIDPQKDADVFQLQNYIDEGRFLAADGDLVIGSGLAKELNVGLGDPILVQTRSRRGVMDVREYEITGIVNTSNPVINRNAIFISLAEAQVILEAPGAASEINLHVKGKPKDTDRLNILGSGISEDLGASYETYTWRDLNAGMFEIAGQKQSVGFFIAFIVIVIALVGIVNTMLLSIYERIPELGTMRAMGFSKGNIRWMMLMEGSVIGFFGGLFGVVLGLVVVILFTEVGFDMTPLLGTYEMPYPMSFVMRGEYNFGYMAFVFFLGWIISTVITLIPARKATRIEPSEALRST
ncbi:MAG: ABC transporter permease [Candidatus Stahlbacteria bacterium]|nr:MAG: ABC transporter permease [Candidatus Stahlbacteria bacterium]